jgi:hypothetical protein
MKMPNVFNEFIDVSSKPDSLALFFALLLSGSLEGRALRFDPRGYGCRFDPLDGKTTDSELRSAATTLLHRPNEGLRIPRIPATQST